MLADDLLPGAQRWQLATRPADPNGDAIGRLARATLLRIERALYARDQVHAHQQVASGFGDNDEAMFYLDAFLISLSGAFDAVARGVHAALGMRGDGREANWRNSS